LAGGGLGVGLGGGVSTTHTTTLAAARLSPPKFEPVNHAAGFLAIGATFLWMAPCGWMVQQKFPDAVIFFALIGGTIAIWWFFYSRRGVKVRERKRQYAKQVEAWARLWSCRRCGYTEDQAPFEPRAAIQNEPQELLS
jgi:hypothetical protein